MSTPSTALKVLIVEDSPADADLMIYHLKQSGYEVIWQRVETEADYLASLADSWDVVLADYVLPRFSGVRALELMHARWLSIPFIIVTGSVSEEAAVACMKQGAADYVLKTQLVRLSESVKRALADQRLQLDKQRAEAALRESEQRYRSVAQSAADAIIAIDSAGHIMAWNMAAQIIFGYTEEEIMGQPATLLLPDDTQAPGSTSFPSFGDMLEVHPAGGTFESTGRHRDGHRFPVEVALGSWQSADGVCHSAIIRDVTERKRVQTAEREQRILAEALRDTAAVLNSTLDFDDVLDHILTNVSRVVPHDTSSIALLENDVSRVVRTHGYDRYGIEGYVESLQLPVSTFPNLREMVKTGRPFIISNIPTDPQWIMLKDSEVMRSYLGAPIQQDGQTIGFIHLLSETPSFYDEGDAERLQAFADQAAIAIRNAQMYNMIQRYAGELEQRVTERTAKLRESEARYRAIVEDQTELIARYLPDGTLTFVNRAYCRFLDQSVDELVGSRFMLFMDDHDRHELVMRIAALSRGAPVTTLEQRVAVPGGHDQWVQWTTRMIFDAHDNFVEYQAVGRDITDLKRAEVALRETLERERELGELRSRFISTVSHEFRTPLAIILTSSETLQKYSHRLTEQERNSRLDRIAASVHRMVVLLDDVLTISRTEPGRMTLQLEPVSIDALCEEIIAETNATVGADLTFSFLPDGNCSSVMADKNAVRLIIGNLISNAAKYTLPGGKVTIELHCNAGQIELSIHDTGIGIPDEDKAHVFDTFHRGRNVGKVPGTGLGLSIAKQSVEQHGGKLTFESQVGTGTSFTVTIPLTAPDNASLAE